MTEANRRQHITQALAQYDGQAGTRDTLRVPLRSSQGMLLEVVELPLDVPVLNAASFRIAPLLAEHPQANLVAKDPHSPAAQAVVAELVRKSHRHIDDLKDSLADGQDQPGLVTRSGKLINANTRCVLLRELRTEGAIQTSTIRVAVLPSDLTATEELELESVVQTQREHKDDYNLVSELMMLKTLHEGGLSDATIARSLRIKPASKVTELREVFELMQRARRLANPPLALTEFISERDQTQNWIELMRRLREVEPVEGRAGGDLTITRWLIAYVSGFNSVHKLRHASGAWIENEVLPDLAEGNDVSATIAAVSNAATTTPLDPVEQPPGLDLLGDEPAPREDADASAVSALLNVAISAAHAGDSDINLPNGDAVPAADVREAIAGSVSRGLAAEKRRSLAGTKLQRPSFGLTQARSGLKDALDALDEVGDLSEFAPLRDNAIVLADEVQGLLEKVIDALNEHDDED